MQIRIDLAVVERDGHPDTAQGQQPPPQPGGAELGRRDVQPPAIRPPRKRAPSRMSTKSGAMKSRSTEPGLQAAPGEEQQRQVDRALGGEQQPGHVAVGAPAVHQDEAQNQVGVDRGQIQVVARAAGDDDRPGQRHEQPSLVQVAAGPEKEVKQHARSDPDRDVDDGPLGGRGRTHPRRHLALVEHGQHEPEGHDRHQGIDPGGELEHRRDPATGIRIRPPPHPPPPES